MKLPPMHALMCFEAAARHLSITKAAEELFVTASAVSQQVSKLEAMTGVRLFIRSPRRLELTTRGRVYLRIIHPAFLQIEEATRRLTEQAGQQKISLSCTSEFAVQWLLPRLSAFEAANPGIEIQINTTHRKVDLLSEGIDFAVRHGTGNYPGLLSVCLIHDPLWPVCSPQLLPSQELRMSPTQLTAYPLLHDEHRAGWALWFEALGISRDHAERGVVFKDSSGVLEAAKAGKGMALIRRNLIADELSDGTLVCPLLSPVDSPLAYFLVCDESALLQPVNRLFRDWITTLAAAERDSSQGVCLD